jgi:hypothetical protein
MGNGTMNYSVKTALGILAVFLVLACQQPDGEGSPFEIKPAIPLKRLVTTSSRVETICYVDTAAENPLNVKDYILAGNGTNPDTLFFNYVVFGFSYLTKDSRGYIHLELTPSLQYMLDNSDTYIKPLHQKGIRVLIEVRSGTFRDDEDGAGIGLGTMDMASIDEFTKELKFLVNQYNIDGFDFNDTGGGKRSYPPFTRDLKRFRSDTPLYPESLFVRKVAGQDPVPLTEDEITGVLWTEGGSNFSNLIQRTNEELKETYTTTWKNGSSETTSPTHIDRLILVRNQNHGRHLLSKLRDAYMPDAYSGADPKVTGNLKYIVNDVPYDNSRLHAFLWDEDAKKDVGPDSDNKYAPFTIDLSNPKTETEARQWANIFLLKNPDGSKSDSDNQNRYGALYITNLPPVSTADSTGLLTYFSRELFGREVRLADTPGAGDYQKPW